MRLHEPTYKDKKLMWSALASCGQNKRKKSESDSKPSSRKGRPKYTYDSCIQASIDAENNKNI